MIVNTSDLVAALKSLKMNQKRRRKLGILIRQGNDPGALVFELRGESPFWGIQTTVYGSGEWSEAILVPAGSLRGIAVHPPRLDKLKIFYRTGQFHVNDWSCPATSVGVK